ncbi:hypothetical protein [Azotobacter beijerinckii]|uniref:Uncharacterized protein n=1 Tax=Azotobacter beijerinckii TaxID=170623 RepID=A0A1I3ZPB7_9GAMM|nr:hypothetical protein [Azotobacter beijerinckii]SFK45760.1 hypothetical protein SAMN04244574_00688 [Azotobacter beijerinckii]
MEINPNQITALLGITLATGLSTAACYLTGRAAGIRLGLQRGHRDGYDAAVDDLGTEVLESADRLTSAERILTATRYELIRVQNLRDLERRQAAEAIEEATLRAEEAKALTDRHATLLRQAAAILSTAAGTWDAMTATHKARDARTVASQLRELAATLQPTQGEQQEAAA